MEPPVDEREAMRRALDLAWRGWGRVQPNPLVGAVVLAGGKVVGEGWHAEFGGPHAEVLALRAAGERARGATLVVTLEPCAHQGKQPPCTDAVVAAKLGRVVAALTDPNPVAAGGGEVLRSRDVEYQDGLLAQEAAAQNAIFLHRIRDRERPFVALKLATSLDGRIADLTGRSRWISGEEAREYVQWLRVGFDAIGVGSATVSADDPSLTVRGPLQPRVPPRRVVFDRRAEVALDREVVRSAGRVPTLVIVSPDAPRARVAALETTGVSVFRVPDLAAGLRALRQAGINSLLVEGGGRLAGALLEAGLVDRYYWLQSPRWLGEQGVPAIAGLSGMPLDRSKPWRVVERRALGQDTLLTLDRSPCSPES
jgi:diaminohydroxyphosphoribosylaminopyrimidine deaminase/5-amino-6-(5-phosphoribosylamino)uracil reductase